MLLEAHSEDVMNDIKYKDVARFSWHYWRQRKSMIPIFLLGMTAAALFDVLFPIILGVMVDAVNEKELTKVLWMLGILMVVELSFHSSRNITIMYWNRFANTTLYKIITDSFSKVQRFSTDWHANAFAGGTVRKMTRGMWSFDMYGDILFLYLYPTAIIFIGIIGYMYVQWPIMGLVTFVFSTLYIVVTAVMAIKINAPRFRRSARADTSVGASLADAITGHSTVKSFGRESAEDKRFEGVATDWRRLSLESWQIATITDLVRRILATAMLGSMLATSIWLWHNGQASTGDLVYVLTSYMVISAYLRNIGEQIANLQKSISEMEDIITFWKREDDILDAPNASVFQAGKGDIVFKDVQFTYQGQTAPLYDGFNVHIKAGEQVALVGHSGSGKSTFVKLVQRLYDVQGGAVLIDKQNIAAVTQESLRQSIALVPQEPVLFHRALWENISYGRPDATQDEIIDAAKQAYAHEFIENLPQGYETLVGERGVKLSGGERQRVAIARAILSDAPVMILDEATSSLDSVSEHYIQKALTNLMEGRTTITIAHRLATIQNADRILVFHKGKIVEEGTHATLIRNENSHYKALYDMQALDLIGEDNYNQNVAE
jgi:ATP-binding cassette subfamily B protein